MPTGHPKVDAAPVVRARHRGGREGSRLLLVPELSAVHGPFSELFLDAEELIVFGHAVAAGGGARLDLAAVRRHGDVGDRRILRLAATVAQDGGVAVAHREVHGLERLAERADLVDLYQDRVGGAGVDALLEE